MLNLNSKACERLISCRHCCIQRLTKRTRAARRLKKSRGHPALLSFYFFIKKRSQHIKNTMLENMEHNKQEGGKDERKKEHVRKRKRS